MKGDRLPKGRLDWELLDRCHKGPGIARFLKRNAAKMLRQLGKVRDSQ